MTLNQRVKYNAKRCLCNNWGKAVAIVLLSTAIYLLFVIIEMMANLLLQLPLGPSGIIPGAHDGWILSFILSSVMAVGSFLLLVPLNLGITFWYHSLSNGNSEDILSIFCCFAHKKLFFRSLWLAVNLGIRSLFHSILYLILPGSALGASLWILSEGTFEGATFIGSMTLVLSSVLMLIAVICLTIHLQKYFLAKYYLMDTKTTVRKAIRCSVHATKGRRDEIFMFKLSFIGWALASVLILPMLYTSAYFSMSSMLFARVLIEDDRRSNSIVPVDSPEDDQQDTVVFDTPDCDSMGK